jgi:uncharacterized YccA/Bax inhibitor family protein
LVCCENKRSETIYKKDRIENKGGETMRSGNPSLTNNTFESYAGSADASDQMTIQGTVNKTFILLVFIIISAIFTWTQYFAGQNVSPYITIGVIGSLIVALVTIFVKRMAPVLSPIYAMLEGLVIGGVSAIYESQFQGITFMAVSLTFSILLGLLLIYKSGLIKVTHNFRLGVAAATLGVLLTYLLNLILGFFGIQVPFIHETGTLGIIVSIVIVFIAALNLVLDFDFIERGAELGAPKYMEWYGAFGIMVTLVWLYLEILRLLYKVLANRN